MLRSSKPWLLASYSMGILACGDPTMLDVSSSTVRDGTTGVYEFTLQNAHAKKFARDGMFGVAYVDGTGATRCSGQAAVSSKDQRHDGEFHVEITFATPCTRVKTTNETKATYTFQPTKGAALSATSPGTSDDLSTWDQSHLTEQRLDKVATALEPVVTSEVKRFAPLAAFVPGPSGPLTVCPPAVAAELRKAAPARLSYDDMLRLASRAPEPGHDDFDFVSEGVHSVMAARPADPHYAATDARMDHFTPPAYVEVFRVSSFERWRIISAGDKHGTYQHGTLTGDVSVIDIAKHQVVCGGPISVRNDKEITGSSLTDDTVKENLAQNYRAARASLEQKIAGGEVPATD
jgi:hypothetical protein